MLRGRQYAELSVSSHVHRAAREVRRGYPGNVNGGLRRTPNPDDATLSRGSCRTDIDIVRTGNGVAGIISNGNVVRSVPTCAAPGCNSVTSGPGESTAMGS